MLYLLESSVISCRLVQYTLQALSAVLLFGATTLHNTLHAAPLSAYATTNPLCMYFNIVGLKMEPNAEMLLHCVQRVYA
jgi:hypothetical protein